MNLKHFLSRLPINKISRFNSRRIPSWNYREICTRIENPKSPIANSLFYRSMHSGQSGQSTVLNDIKSAQTVSVDTENDENAVMNEFLSRFVWIMRGKLTDVYTDADKKEIDAMLHIIVEKVVTEMEDGSFDYFVDSAEASASEDFSEDLWKTVKEVSSIVIEDMKNAKKKEKMKSFLQSEEVKEMARFAGEIGIRGDLLRELRFKWAREKLEDNEFYESLQRMREDANEPENVTETKFLEASRSDDDDESISLPKRSGKIRYNIYGLDLSKPKWAEVAENIHENAESIWAQEPKPISGKCKIVTEKILNLKLDDDFSPLIEEWIELLQPTKVDWIALLDKLKQQNHQLYFKVAEHLLDEESFQTDIRDYSQLVDAYAKNNQLTDAERIIKKMNEKGVTPDILMKTSMVHMYSKSGNLNLAKEAFETLRTQGFQPDLKVYNSMIMAYLNEGDRKSCELLISDLEKKSVKPSENTYLALLNSCAKDGDLTGANRIWNKMQFAGYKPSVESCKCLVEVNSRKGTSDEARKHFDEIFKLGLKPDDECISRMMSAYSVKNLLDKGLQLLLTLEKDGVEYGVLTYSVLVDWLCKMQLVDEVEGILVILSEKNLSLSVGGYVSLCDMYSRVHDEKKALQALGVIEANIEKLRGDEFERVINGLKDGGFFQDSERMVKLMVDQGFDLSNRLMLSLQASQTFKSNRSWNK